MASKKKVKDEETVIEAAEVKEEPKMVTAKVTVAFRDRYTGQLWKSGDILAVTEERFAEINSQHKHIELA